jgi:tetratricopeptide (TPR) repeat protein
VTEDSAKARRQLEAQVERWIAEAKKLAEAGDAVGALDLYKKAADELPGAPWLQHRTGELSRQLKQPEAAITYYRRAATAFQLAQFAKRAIPPLRTAWTIAVDNLPATSKGLVQVSLELMQIQRGLGLAADASITLERTNAALRARGFSEITPQAESAPAPPPSSISTRSITVPSDASSERSVGSATAAARQR